MSASMRKVLGVGLVSFLVAFLTSDLALAERGAARAVDRPAEPALVSMPEQAFTPAEVAVAQAALFDDAVRAYRAGDLASARALFEALLTNNLAPEARGPVLYNLGNLHYREGRFAFAVAALTGAVEALPRSSDAWENLELARAKAGLDPADRGDLAATAERVVGMARPGELELVGWVLLALLALLAGLELFRGGAGLRAGLALVLLLLVLDLAWLAHASARASAPSVVVVESSELFAEPNADHALGRRATLGERIEVLERLGAPGARGTWVKVATGEGTGWLQESAVYDWR